MSEQMTSNKPYVVRAFYEWILDNNLTPYIVVDTTVYGVLVPLNFVTDNQIVLNISPDSVGGISLVGDAIEFSARFGGKLERLFVPYGSISAIYAKENGAGTSLAVEHTEPPTDAVVTQPSKTLASVESTNKEDATDTKRKKGRASLKVIK